MERELTLTVMAYFLCKLIPPRPTFAQDMNEVEREAMQRHVAHWTELMRKGTVIAFGPVLDPQGVWGLGLVEVQDDKELNALGEGDPLLAFGFRVETYPMAGLVSKK